VVTLTHRDPTPHESGTLTVFNEIPVRLLHRIRHGAEGRDGIAPLIACTHRHALPVAFTGIRRTGCRKIRSPSHRWLKGR